MSRRPNGRNQVTVHGSLIGGWWLGGGWMLWAVVDAAGRWWPQQAVTDRSRPLAFAVYNAWSARIRHESVDSPSRRTATPTDALMS